MSLSKNINPSLVLVQPRKNRPYITERLLMGCKESNHIKQAWNQFIVLDENKSELADIVCVLLMVETLDYLNRKFPQRYI